MGGFLNLWPLALVRLRSRWHMTLPLLLGAVLAVALISSTVIYGDAIRQLGLEHSLRQSPPEDLDIDLLAYNAPVDAESYQSIRRQVEDAINRNLWWFVEERQRGMKGSTLFVNTVARGGQPPDLSPEGLKEREAANARLDPRPRAVFLFHEALDDRMELVQGKRPAPVTIEAPAPDPAANPEIPVLITQAAADQRGLAIGDRIVVTPFWDSTTPYVVARVEGVVRPRDGRDRYWLSAAGKEAASLVGQNYVPMYVPEGTFQGAVGRLLPEMLTDYSWTVMVDPSRITPNSARLAAFGVDRVGRQLRTQMSVGFLQETSLDRDLQAFGTKDVFGRVPLLIVIVMIVAVIFFYLVMVANVVVERHLGEMALLRSRGADPPQLLAVYAWEALFLSAAAFVLGPLLAWGATLVLGYTSIFAGLTGGGALPARLTSEVVLAGWLASLVSLVALLLPTLKGVRLELTAFKSAAARPVTDSVFTRYYLDVFAALVAAVIFWELTQRGSVFSTTLLGETQADQALLAAPALILLAVALLFLRVFPLVMRGMAWLASRVGTIPLVLGFWHLGRNPMPYALPTLLLMLASAIAMFAANFGATVSRSHADRAAYEAGSAVRVLDGQSTGDESLVAIATRESARIGMPSSPAYRGDASMALNIFNFSAFSLLAVDPASFSKVTWYREDFSQRPLAEVLDLLARDTPREMPGVAIPNDATGLGVWALPADPRRSMLLLARIVDGAGRYDDIPLGVLDGEEWKLLTGDFRDGRSPRTVPLERPFRLVSLFLVQTRGGEVPAGVVFLDSIETVGPAPVTLVDLRDLSQSSVIQDNNLTGGDALELNEQMGRPGRGPAAAFIWAPGSPLVTRGLVFQQGGRSLGTPLNAVVSRSFAEGQGTRVGDVVTLGAGHHAMPVRISGVVDFFPTLDPYQDGFVVMNLPALMARLNAISPLDQAEPNEIWLAGGGDARAVLNRLEGITPAQVIDRERLLLNLEEDPLVAAGWTGVLRMAFLAVLFTTLMGFSVYSLAQAQKRRAEFAMLRSLGLSPLSLGGVVLVEQLLVVAIGMALGSWLGVRLTELIMPFLGLSEAGQRVLPPFAVAMDWGVIAVVYGVMAAVFVITSLALIGLFSRMAIQRALRFGEV